MIKLRESARDQSCVACGAKDGTVVLAHYFGPRRFQYGGGLAHKGNDAVGAHLCAACHSRMDTKSRSKEDRWLVSEEMLHYCALTWIRWIEDGTLR